MRRFVVFFVLRFVFVVIVIILDNRSIIFFLRKKQKTDQKTKIENKYMESDGKWKT